MRPRIDGMAVVALAIILFMLLNVLRDAGWIDAAPVEKVNTAAMSAVPLALGSKAETASTKGAKRLANSQEPKPNPDADLVVAPYDHYVLTQGLHGFSYGHMAIDITGGKRATIKSPINGIVSDLYVDEWGNPTLVIENEHYRVTLLHGIYKVKVGDVVKAGQPVGKESNLGNTVDALGQSCRGRDCGYHTHLNIYDKQLGANVNPLELIEN
ncbi:MAG: peptidoglycan DD-metalloendopeptidase family protein [Anaerolineales bacterium]|nr:peptidoglycan DD-metalloendopeptidase family protein [Anaerolineales bacterium]